jgi:hypothetical protein
MTPFAPRLVRLATGYPGQGRARVFARQPTDDDSTWQLPLGWMKDQGHDIGLVRRVPARIGNPGFQ